MVYKAIISCLMTKSNTGHNHCEIHEVIQGREPCDIFDDIESEIADQVQLTDSETEKFLIVCATAEYVTSGWEIVEYDIEYGINIPGDLSEVFSFLNSDQ